MSDKGALPAAAWRAGAEERVGAAAAAFSSVSAGTLSTAGRGGAAATRGGGTGAPLAGAAVVDIDEEPASAPTG